MRVTSRPTPIGWGAIGLFALTMMGAFTTTNNLLYLLYSVIGGALAAAWFLGRRNLKGVRAEAELPDQIFRGDPFKLRLRLFHSGRLPRFGLEVRGGRVDRLDPGGRGPVEFPFWFTHRGLNAAEGIEVESGFPLGIFRHRALLSGISGTALPRMREVHCAAEITADASLTGRPMPKKGRGDELYGIRDYDESDDSRQINWKLTAKAAKPLVNEYCAPGDSRVTVRIDNVGTGEGAERQITEAASAFRYYIDTGADVRLVTPEGGVGYGKGLLHLDKALRLLASLGEGKNARPSKLPYNSGWAIADTPALRRWTFAVAALVYAALFLIDEIDVKLLACVAPVIPLGWLLYELKGPRLPKLLWNLASVLMLGFVLLLDWRVAGVAIANTHLVIYLIANRVLVDLAARELPQVMLILLLAFFLVSGLTISPWYFLVFILFVAFNGIWFMLATGFASKARRRWTPALAGVVLASLAVGGVVFTFSPRTEGLRRINPFTAMGIDKFQPKKSAVAGFSERVSLGFYGELKKSQARMMRIRPETPPSKGKPAPIYVRGVAFDIFDGRSWTKTKADFIYRYGEKRYFSADGKGWALQKGREVVFPGGGNRRPGLEFIYYPMHLNVLFTVDSLAAVERKDVAAYFDYTDTVYFAAAYLAGTRCVTYPRPGALGFGASIPGYEKLVRERFLQLPEKEDGRVAALARQITDKFRTDAARARAIEAFLRREYDYSTFSRSEDKDLAGFLFEDKKGNCEYFATAAAVLLRHAGIPSRLVTGFLASEWNEYGKFYDVRQGQAHAWTEAYVDGQWMTLEPTPASQFSRAADAFLKRMERLANAIELSWYRHIIGYDTYSQRNTFFRLSQALSPERLLQWLEKALPTIGLSALLAALVLALPHLRLLRRRPQTLFERAESVLEKAGFKREPHLTPLEHALETARRRPELKDLVPLTELHYLDRYREPLAPEQMKRAEALLAGLRASLKR